MSDPMTPLSSDELQRLREMEKKATPAPWEWSGQLGGSEWRDKRRRLQPPPGHGTITTAEMADNDRALVEHGRNALPTFSPWPAMPSP